MSNVHFACVVACEASDRARERERANDRLPIHDDAVRRIVNSRWFRSLSDTFNSFLCIYVYVFACVRMCVGIV